LDHSKSLFVRLLGNIYEFMDVDVPIGSRHPSRLLGGVANKLLFFSKCTKSLHEMESLMFLKARSFKICQLQDKYRQKILGDTSDLPLEA
jgi:hypothetical protein